MSNGSNVYFIVGHHGTGKTYLLEQLKKDFKLIHIDTGPLIRDIYKKQTENCEITMGEWIKKGEEEYGVDYTNSVLCEAMEESINNVNNYPIFITGNRSIEGINYISKYFGFSDKIKIIYLDAPFKLLKDNYISREQIILSDVEFKEVLDKEIKSGLNDIKKYTLANLGTCIYHYKTTNDEIIYNFLRKGLICKTCVSREER